MREGELSLPSEARAAARGLRDPPQVTRGAPGRGPPCANPTPSVQSQSRAQTEAGPPPLLWFPSSAHWTELTSERLSLRGPEAAWPLLTSRLAWKALDMIWSWGPER